MGVVADKVKVLEVLSKATEPMRPLEVGEILGITQLEAGNRLYQLFKSNLVQKPEPEKSFYSITDKGREWMNNPPPDYENPPRVKKKEAEKGSGEEAEKGSGEEAEKGSGEEAEKGSGKEPLKEPTGGVLPSQAYTFREFGERMGIGGGKGEIKLDAIMFYLGKMADFDDPASLWNGLTEMGVDDNVRKRWLKLYLSTKPGKKIPDELKAKLDSFDETLDTKETAAEAEPKFAVDETTGRIRAAKDSERPMTWKEAEKVADRIKGELKKEETQTSEPAFVVGEGGTFTMNPRAKIGLAEFAIFQMYQESLRRGNPIDPIEEMANREEQAKRLKEVWGVPGKAGNSEVGTIERLQQLGLLKAGGDLAETVTLLDSLGLLAKPGAGGENEGLKEMRQELANLRDTLAKKDMEAVTNELTGVKGVIATLRQEMEIARSSQAAKGEYDIMAQAIGMVDRRLGAIENTITGVFKRPPNPLGKEAKADITEAITEEVESEAEQEELGAALWGPKTESK